jgi:hypothetical protein
MSHVHKVATIEGHLRGVPLSGKADDAFPSGHALHIGALAAAATLLPTPWRNLIWTAGAAVVAHPALSRQIAELEVSLEFRFCKEARGGSSRRPLAKTL